MSDDVTEAAIAAAKLKVKNPGPSKKSRYHKDPELTERKKREHRVDKSVEKCAGYLERLLDMKDVLYEILKHLSLEDLINVSRSSKFFAPWLLSRNHQSIWIAARQNYPVPIPAPRAPFKEQRWAAALVERYCHNCCICTDDRVSYRAPQFERVLCYHCYKDHTLAKSTMLLEKTKLGVNHDDMEAILTMLPAHNTPLHKGPRVYIPEYDAVKEHYFLLEEGEQREEFKKARLEYVKRAEANFEAMEKWIQDKHTWYRTDSKNKLEIIKQGLYAKRYTDSDFPVAEDGHGQLQQWNKVFEPDRRHNWDQLPERLEGQILRCRTLRYDKRCAEFSLALHAWKYAVALTDLSLYDALLGMEDVQDLLRERSCTVPMTITRFGNLVIPIILRYYREQADRKPDDLVVNRTSGSL